MSYWAEHPPRHVRSATDGHLVVHRNNYITFLLQGGVILLAAYLGTLGSSLARRRESPLSPSVAPSIGVVALTGLTQTSAIPGPRACGLLACHRDDDAPGARTDGMLESPGPRRAAASERTRRRFTAALGGTLVLLVFAAVGIRSPAGCQFSAGDRPGLHPAHLERRCDCDGPWLARSDRRAPRHVLRGPTALGETRPGR